MCRTSGSRQFGQISTGQVAGSTIETPHGLRKCFEARVERTGRKPLVGRFGGIPLRRDKKTVINNRRLAPVNTKRKELVTRLLAGRCEACGRIDEVEVHHVAKLTDLGRPGDRRRGQISWPHYTAKPLWSAALVMRTSTAGNL